jgi:molybdate/tungstate transport system permease protein
VKRRDLPYLLTGIIILVVLHVVAFAWFTDLGTNAVLLCANVFALYNGVMYERTMGHSRTTLYVAGYLALFVVLFALARSPLLFAVMALLYAAVFRSPTLLGYFIILALSIIVITPYWFQSFLVAGAAYTILIQLRRRRQQRFVVVFMVVGLALLLAVIFPLLYLCFQSAPQTLLVTLREGDFQRALLNSLATSTATTLIVLLFGVPLAYALARSEFRGKEIINSLIDLPIIIPQTVVGIALLVLMGPKTPVGQFMSERLGLSISGTYLGIIACQIFVSCPFLIRSAMNAFQDMGPQLENVSRTLGASPASTFFRVSLPLASGAIFNGCILTWSRAISEVGSIMVLAYHPFTVSIYTHDTFVQYGLEEARPISVLLVIICLWGFLVLRWLRRNPLGWFGGRREAAAS